ncbi:uncharacterized protein L969DRAFT_95104 [Mixia osmundae IAM 14324]|uniref:Uncharacterized protein n=1 Tax=Mixia osmundae (strain CBS 9802 / IAM 14324 / JCM 22182 / KY 12970) TaxID=764103 RepID=G7E761_MIXOS|nr:uncharacterized protein L969DRAFT_95104 [Mixia osmundae IAM 14324]KEI38943.1 hypothetical protein L969DRAFT_95104 [Mixia osmundae IAM 14324]GAA98671.1 hypothetical protein E5Q_05359 [Mixia osmundae IAM 14324]
MMCTLLALVTLTAAKTQSIVWLTSATTHKPGLYLVWLSAGPSALGSSIAGMSTVCNSSNTKFTCSGDINNGLVVGPDGREIQALNDSLVNCKPGLYSVYLSGGSADLGKSIGGLSMACGSTNLHYVCQDAAGGGNIVNGAGEDIVAPGGSYVACVPWVPPIFC